MLMSTTPTSNWPHALDALVEKGKRRRKHYFPEGLPGLFTLSKTEVADDIDLIEADVDRSAFGHARRRACRMDSSGNAKDDMEIDQEFGETTSSVHNPATTKVSKRQRLIDRLLDEHGIRDDARIELTKVRRALDDTRDQITSYRDGIARLQRQIAQCQQEEAALKTSQTEREKTLKVDKEAMEQTRQQLDAHLAESKAELAEAMTQVEQLQRYEQAALAKDVRIQTLELEIEMLKREAEVAKKANVLYEEAGSADIAIASGSVGGGANSSMTTGLETFVRHYTTDLHEVTRRLKEMSGRVVELEREKSHLENAVRAGRTQVEEAQKSIAEAATKNASYEAVIEQLKDGAKLAREENESVKKIAERLTYDIEMGNEKMSAYAMVVDASEVRAQSAEQRLLQTVHSTSVLRGGNIQLQEKYNRLMQQHSSTCRELASLEEELASARASANQAIPSDEDALDPDAILKRSLQQDLKCIQLDVERLVDEQENVMDEEVDPSIAAVLPIVKEEFGGDDAGDVLPMVDQKPLKASTREIASRRRSSRS